MIFLYCYFGGIVVASAVSAYVIGGEARDQDNGEWALAIPVAMLACLVWPLSLVFIIGYKRGGK